MVFLYETHPAWINPRRICSASVNPTSPRFLKPLLLSYCAAQFDRKPFYVWFILAPVNNHELIQLVRCIPWLHVTFLHPNNELIFPDRDEVFLNKTTICSRSCCKVSVDIMFTGISPLWSEVAHLMWMMAAVREPLACVTSAMASYCCSVQQQVPELCSTPVSMSTCG